MTYPYIHCGAFGHAWYEYDGSRWTPEFGMGQVVRCERCGSERRDSINRNGAIEARSYDHPDGYKMGPGQRPSRADFRRMAWELHNEGKISERAVAADQLAARRKRKRVS